MHISDVAEIIVHAGFGAEVHPLLVANRSLQAALLPLVVSTPALGEDKCEGTRLHRAAFYGLAARARLLLYSGASANCRCATGRTPLMWACQSPFFSEDLAEMLRVAGANLLARDRDGGGALNHAARCGRTAALEWLVNECGVAADAFPYHAGDRAGCTPLLDAARFGSGEGVLLLARRGADVHHTDCEQATALMLAATNGNEEAVAALLSASADVTTRDGDGWTALHFAAKAGSVDCVHMLLGVGDRRQQTSALTSACCEFAPGCTARDLVQAYRNEVEGLTLSQDEIEGLLSLLT